jgi:hypothetical protein
MIEKVECDRNICYLVFRHLSRASSVSFTTRLGLELILALGSLCRVLDERHLEDIAHSSLKTLPHSERSGSAPIQGTDPRLDIVLQLQGAVFGSSNLGPWGSDLVLWLLVRELQDSRSGALGVGLVVCLGCDLAAVGMLAGLLRVDVCVFVPGLRGSWDDGVPDDCFRRRREERFRGERRGHINKDLLGVPGEERCEICKRSI